ncbi:MAG: hypothetical protein H6Q16_500 [Bacteroidetes bacterium]|nr:hypothetical protein [Bacteroidota bacterium]
MEGEIDRDPFTFIADNCKIWYEGECIKEINSKINITGNINLFSSVLRNKMQVSIDNSEISDYIADRLLFKEISRLNDRILWSNNFLNDYEGAEYKNMSLFFSSGVLSRISINRSNPLYMIEFNSTQQEGKIDDEDTINILNEKASAQGDKQGMSLGSWGALMGGINLSNFIFKSNSHQRYENNQLNGQIQENCHRSIIIKENINGCEGYIINNGEGYIVSIINDSDSNLYSGNKTMSPKPMKIISQSEDKIVLRGYKCKAVTPFGAMDFSGDDYGMTISLKNNKVDSCTLHMHDRNINIKYMDIKQENKVIHESKPLNIPVYTKKENNNNNFLIGITVILIIAIILIIIFLSKN